MPDQPETTEPQARTLPRLLALALGTGALFAATLAQIQIPCWGLFVLAALIAWPLWVYGNEVALFERRMRLEHLTRADSGLRRWLWAGTLTRVLQAVVALVLALLLLLLAARLRAEHWVLLALDLLLLSLLVDPIQRRLRGQIQDRHLGLIARRWPLLGINLALLTLGFAALDFFLIGMPDTRGLPWHQVAEDAFRAEGLGAACGPAGWALGMLAAAETLARHAAQVAIPGLPDPVLRLVAWGLVLVHAGALAYLFTRLQLGILALVERRLAPGPAEGGFTRAFVYTILALAIPTLYATSRLAQVDPERLAEQARRAASWVDPCQGDPAARTALLAELGAELDQARRRAQAEANQRIDAELDALFARIEPGVDAYLDWYFTLIGEYERLAALATGGFVELMGDQLERHLFLGTGFAERIEALDGALGQNSAAALAEAAKGLGRVAGSQTGREPCALSGLDLGRWGSELADLGLVDPSRDAARAATAAGGGAAAGAVAAKVLAKQAGAEVVAKLAAKKGFQAAAGLAGKVAAKKGGSILLSAAGAAALCSPGGPAAALCGIAAGAAAWLAVDKALVEIDAVRLRDQMRAEILEVLEDQKPALALALKARHAARIDAGAAQIQASLERVFVPARDGL